MPDGPTDLVADLYRRMPAARPGELLAHVSIEPIVILTFLLPEGYAMIRPTSSDSYEAARIVFRRIPAMEEPARRSTASRGATLEGRRWSDSNAAADVPRWRGRPPRFCNLDRSSI